MEFENLVAPSLVGIVLVATTIPLTASLQVLHQGRALFIGSSVSVVCASIPIIFVAFQFPIEVVAWTMALQYAVILGSTAVILLRTRIVAASLRG